MPLCGLGNLMLQCCGTTFATVNIEMLITEGNCCVSIQKQNKGDQATLPCYASDSTMYLAINAMGRRASLSLGKVLAISLLYQEAEEEFVVRTVAQLPADSGDFGSLPAHVGVADEEVSDVFKGATPILVEQVLPSTGSPIYRAW